MAREQNKRLLKCKKKKNFLKPKYLEKIINGLKKYTKTINDLNFLCQIKVFMFINIIFTLQKKVLEQNRKKQK